MGADVALAADSAVVGGSVHVGFAISPAQAGRPYQRARREANQPAQRQVGARDKAWFALDSMLEGAGFEPSVPGREASIPSAKWERSLR
jgi:hypothetical protein